MADYTVSKANTVIACYKVYARATAFTAANIGSDLASSLLKPNDGTTQANWATTSPSAYTDFGRIGPIEGGVTFKTGEGKTIDLGACDEHVLSEIVEINFVDTNVSKDNYSIIRALCAYGNVDIVLYDPDNASKSIAFRDMNLRAFISGESGSNAKVEMSAKKEANNSDNNISMITVT